MLSTNGIDFINALLVCEVIQCEPTLRRWQPAVCVSQSTRPPSKKIPSPCEVEKHFHARARAQVAGARLHGQALSRWSKLHIPKTGGQSPSEGGWDSDHRRPLYTEVLACFDPRVATGRVDTTKSLRGKTTKTNHRAFSNDGTPITTTTCHRVCFFYV